MTRNLLWLAVGAGIAIGALLSYTPTMRWAVQPSATVVVLEPPMSREVGLR